MKTRIKQEWASPHVRKSVVTLILGVAICGLVLLGTRDWGIVGVVASFAGFFVAILVFTWTLDYQLQLDGEISRTKEIRGFLKEAFPDNVANLTPDQVPVVSVFFRERCGRELADLDLLVFETSSSSQHRFVVTRTGSVFRVPSMSGRKSGDPNSVKTIEHIVDLSILSEPRPTG